MALHVHVHVGFSVALFGGSLSMVNCFMRSGPNAALNGACCLLVTYVPGGSALGAQSVKFTGQGKVPDLVPTTLVAGTFTSTKGVVCWQEASVTSAFKCKVLTLSGSGATASLAISNTQFTVSSGSTRSLLQMAKMGGAKAVMCYKHGQHTSAPPPPPPSLNTPCVLLLGAAAGVNFGCIALAIVDNALV
jgi:hypothetical protein